MQIYPTHEELSLISKHSTGKKANYVLFFFFLLLKKKIIWCEFGMI